MYLQTQKLCAWSGLFGTVLFFVGITMAGFFPPPSPSWTVEQVVSHYQQNVNGIRAGMVLMMISGMFIAPMVAVVSVQMRRLEKTTPVMTYTQLVAGATGILFFIIPALLFLVTAFRPERPPELTYLMNDLSWIVTVIPYPSQFMVCVAVGVCVLNHPDNNIFPRWLAFFNFWLAIGFIPASLLPWFRTGPFAWNGIFPFWLAGTLFFVWFLVMAVVLVKAINQQAKEAAA